MRGLLGPARNWTVQRELISTFGEVTEAFAAWCVAGGMVQAQPQASDETPQPAPELLDLSSEDVPASAFDNLPRYGRVLSTSIYPSSHIIVGPGYGDDLASALAIASHRIGRAWQVFWRAPEHQHRFDPPEGTAAYDALRQGTFYGGLQRQVSTPGTGLGDTMAEDLALISDALAHLTVAAVPGLEYQPIALLRQIQRDRLVERLAGELPFAMFAAMARSGIGLPTPPIQWTPGRTRLTFSPQVTGLMEGQWDLYEKRLDAHTPEEIDEAGKAAGGLHCAGGRKIGRRQSPITLGVELVLNQVDLLIQDPTPRRPVDRSL